MLRMVLGCAVACGSSMPACAGDRDAVPPGLKATAAHAVPARAALGREAPAARHVLASVNPRAVTTITLPARSRTVYDIAAPSSAAQVIAADSAHPHVPSAFALPEPRPQPAWQLTDPSSEVTARAGGRYAVGETLADHRRVGPRRSALDAMLVLRIDGSDDSPPLSLGGGVAGAMWKAGVTR